MKIKISIDIETSFTFVTVNWRKAYTIGYFFIF